MRVLALDLGTATGWALSCDGAISVGTWKLASAKEINMWGKVRLTRRKDPRVERLCEHISSLGSLDVIVYEDVLFSTTTLATQLWSALRSAVWLCATAACFECLPVATLKKWASGNGAATKEMMGACLKRDHPDLYQLCDSEDAVDAAHLLLWAVKNLTRAQTSIIIPR